METHHHHIATRERRIHAQTIDSFVCAHMHVCASNAVYHNTNVAITYMLFLQRVLYPAPLA